MTTTFKYNTLGIRNPIFESLPTLDTGSSPVSFEIPLFVTRIGSGMTDFAAPPTNFCVIQNSQTDPYVTLQAAPLPRGVVSSVGVYVQGASGHGGMPAQKPRVHLYTLTASTGALAANTQTDATTDVPTYETRHVITNTYSWSTTACPLVLFVQGESSTDYVVGLKVFLWATVTMSITSLTPQ